MRASLIIFLSSCVCLFANAKPNIVFILADDMGYADLGCYGAKDVDTPNIDQLAATGVKFTNVYAMGAECTPSRTSILTGQYPQRCKGMECAIGTGNVGRYDDAIALAEANNLGLPANKALLAPALKRAGYHNGVFGKWHLGYEEKFSPLEQGFDAFGGFLGGNVDYFHHVELSPIHVLLKGKEKVKRDGYTTDLITQDAVDFINARGSDSFFLYLPHAAPHFPFQAPDSDTTLPTKETWLDGDRPTYAKMLKSLDDSVGKVVEALKNKGLIENTLIVFASDHGAIRPGDNGPYRDFKSTLFEGGIRVPLIANWPKHLAGGKEFYGVGTLMDLSHSFLRIAGEKTATCDGIDLLKFAAENKLIGEREIPWRAKRGDRTWKAYRKGDWKYLSKMEGGKFEEWLFDLNKDPYEKENLIKTSAQVGKDLKARLDEWEQDLTPAAPVAKKTKKVARKPLASIQLATYPSLSPDGKQIVFSWNGDIWIANSKGGKAEKISTHPASDERPLISPDGTRVAFTSSRSGQRQVWVMPLSGGSARQLTFHSEGSRAVDWYPDGKSILTEGYRDAGTRSAYRFYRVNALQRGKEILLFDSEGSEPVLSPDGKRLLFTRESRDPYRKGYRGTNSSQIWMAENLETAEVKFTKIIARESGARTPMWKPDGSGFYYLGDHGKQQRFNVWEYQFKGKKDQQLTYLEEEPAVFSRISRDGSQIVFRSGFEFHRYSPGGKKAQVEKIPLKPSSDTLPDYEVRRILTKATNVSYSPDGLEIAFAAGGDLWVMDTVLREPVNLTNTAAEEGEPVFSRDGKTLFFIRDSGTQSDIYSTTRADNDKWWWQNTSFVEKELTQDGAAKINLQAVPGGLRISWISGLGDLWVAKTDGTGAKRILESWNQPDYTWAPDGRWIAWSVADNDFNRDIWIADAGAKNPRPFNVSRHPDSDTSPAWSPNGKILAFTGRRFEKETDIYYVYLKDEDEETDQRDRKLQQALEKMQKSRKKPVVPKKIEPVKKPTATSEKPKESKPKVEEPKKPIAAPKPKPAARKTLQIDFEGLYDRIHRISIANSAESGLLWSHDSKRLAFSAEVKGVKGTYYVSFPDKLTPTFLTSKRGSLGKWIAKDDRILWLADGVPSSVLFRTKSTYSYTFKARQRYDRRDYWQTAFRQIWRNMGDIWYDENLNNLDWAAVGDKYESAASLATDSATFDRAISMMLGELNGSHLGFRSSAKSSYRSGQGWHEQTAHLGVQFDRFFAGPGWKVKSVLPDGPADQNDSKLKRGDIILSIDGTALTQSTDPTLVLNGEPDRTIELTIKADQPKTIYIRSTTYANARTLAKKARIKYHASMVDKLSKGKAGYVYVPSMTWNEFIKFEEEIFARGAGKDGLIIDVRDNGGGFTTDHLLMVLRASDHAITVPRGGGPGYPQDRLVYASWKKPITVLCNQNSFSNAEIFSHAIKELKRGKVVGVPTAGGVVSTGSKRIMDIGTLRIPFRGWYRKSDGADMEMNPAVPDVILWPEPDEIAKGKDSQLEKAVEVLLKDIETERQKKQPELVPASKKRVGGK